MNKHHPYGYKVGYRQNNKSFVRLFITKTRKRASHVLNYYQKYGHINYRKNEIERFNYLIKPITKKEVLAGIWDELPFERLRLFFIRKQIILIHFPFRGGLSSHRTNANVNGPAKNYSNFSGSR